MLKPIPTTSPETDLTCSLLHFALWVWACVDTDVRRRTTTARQMAHMLIDEMRARGELPPAAQPLLAPRNEDDPASARYFAPSSAPPTPAMREVEPRYSSVPVDDGRIV